MSIAYDEYLKQHKANVIKGMEWIRDNLPDYWVKDAEWLTTFQHDESKTSQEEYDAYDAHFYGNNRSWIVEMNFKRAWLHHIHNNPHHWQHWVLINDDEGIECLAMPIEYVIEMICDWWSFGWKTGDLYSLFTWYDEHWDIMKLNATTKILVADILDAIRKKLEEQK